MTKSDDAFRTISEVASELGLATHVLRFWESKFPQIKPLKRAGGRRYYRPDDVALLRRLQSLLHDEGYTIKGVQKLFREEGARKFIDEGTVHSDESAVAFDQNDSEPSVPNSQASLFDESVPGSKPIMAKDVPAELIEAADLDEVAQENAQPSIQYRPGLLPEAPEPEPFYAPDETQPAPPVTAGLSDTQRQTLRAVLAELQEMKKQIDAVA